MTSVVIIRRRHPLEGQSLATLGRMRRHGRLELLLVLPDGSKRLIPRAWTDQAEDGAAGDGVATLGAVADLLAACALVHELVRRRGGELGAREREAARLGRLGAERALTLVQTILARHGFEPRRHSTTELRLHNCPFHPFAANAPALVCGITTPSSPGCWSAWSRGAWRRSSGPPLANAAYG